MVHIRKDSVTGKPIEYAKVKKPRKFSSMNAFKPLFHVDHATVVDTSTSHQMAVQFIANTDIDVYSVKVRFTILKGGNSFFSVLDRVKKHIPDARLVMIDHGTVCLHKPNFLGILGDDAKHNEDTEDVFSLKFDIYGERSEVESFENSLSREFGSELLPKIKWWYDGRHGAETRDIYLPNENTILCPEFYPDLGDPNVFMDNYLASKASVLLLAGPPGTGKTTLLRRLILDKKLSAHVIYDEKLMEKDSVFQGFLFDDDSKIMIIEDADTILSDRERDGNKMMARFLSVSDGLIKLPNKKLVFTTNLGAADFSKVDDALLRPGRCYGVIRTRELDLSEAQAAAKVAGLPIPIEKKQYTIAELFNQDQVGRARIRRVGF